MQASDNIKWRRGFRAAAKAAKIAGLGVLISLAVCALAAMIFWEADFYAARDRYEHMRLALFGPWSPKPEKTVKDIFEQVDSVSLFTRSFAPGLGVIHTGSSYHSSEAVTQDRPQKKWCYVVLGKNAAGNHIQLGEQQGNLPATFTDPISIDQEILESSGVSAERLSQLARQHCKFSS